jgi:Na+/pantothenate symporter
MASNSSGRSEIKLKQEQLFKLILGLMITVTLSRFEAGGAVSGMTAGFLMGLVWIYLAVVFLPIWVPYGAIKGAHKLSHSLGIL